MIARTLLPLFLIAGAAQAANLPLRPGTYVLAGTPCAQPPFAAMFDYDGRAFSYPHASHCRSVVLSRAGRTYRVRETCSAAGDGTPEKPVTLVSTYRVLSRERVELRKVGSKGADTYRWCSPAQVNAAS